MTINSSISTTVYRKYNSFQEYILPYRRTTPEIQVDRSLRILSNSSLVCNHLDLPSYTDVIQSVAKSLKLSVSIKDNNLSGAAVDFRLSDLVSEELATIEDHKVPLYLYHRWRYERYPALKQHDKYPPYAQIEPSSICNYRCKFCYQTDETFSGKGSTYMSTMNYETYKAIVDKLEKKVEFISLASRGEPFICKDLGKMLAYSRDKFLCLKINTNASLMTEELAHSILRRGASTIVFSVDAHSRDLYEELRVNGNYDKLLKGISLFNNIRQKHYQRDQSIVRLSGVYIDDRQDMNLMQQSWGEYVDQITFVKYNPWENVYLSEKTNIVSPCSDLWRRLFIWHDGTVNCCDTDYKSTLLSDSLLESDLEAIWLSPAFNNIREKHLNHLRSSVFPCTNCSVI